MKKPVHDTQKDHQTHPALRTIELHRLMFGGTSQTATTPQLLGTSLGQVIRLSGPKYPDDAGE